MTAIARFLGDSPWRVLLKLLVVSFLAGLVMNAFGWWPADVWFWLRQSIADLWFNSFAVLETGLRYVALGAVVVVPIFLVIRLVRIGR